MRLVAGFTLMLVALAGCGSSDVVVNPPEPEYELVFDSPYQGTIHIAPGGTGTVQAHVRDRSGHLVVPDQGPTFHSSNPEVVTVDPAGHFTVVGVGAPAEIIAEARVGSSEVTATISVAVVCTLELTVSVVPQAMTLDVGQHFTPVLTLTSCGGWVTVPATVTWSTPDPGILAVNPQTGEATALQSGSATVRGTATIQGGTSIIGSIAVTVR